MCKLFSNHQKSQEIFIKQIFASHFLIAKQIRLKKHKRNALEKLWRAVPNIMTFLGNLVFCAFLKAFMLLKLALCQFTDLWYLKKFGFTGKPNIIMARVKSN